MRTDVQMDRSAFLGEEPVFRLLMKMSIPAITGMLAGALYNVVDTIFVGRGAGPLAIAGLTVAFPLQIIVYAFAFMVGAGAASIISRRLGEKNMEEAEINLGTALTSITGMAILMTFVVWISPSFILRLFGATEEVIPYASDYVKTVLWGFPFSAVSMAGNNLIRAEGNARVAMATMLIGTILNIIMDPIFIFSLGMGIKGAALATVISQSFSFTWVIYHYLSGRSAVAVRMGYLRIKWIRLKRMLVLGIPNGVHVAGMSLIITIINNILGNLGGGIAISTYGMANRLLSFIYMPIMGISQGFQPIAGYNYGARKFRRVKRVLFLAFIVSTSIASVSYVFIRLFPEAFMGLFTKDRDLIEFSSSALLKMSLLIPIIGIQSISSIFFQAIGKALPSVILGLSRQFILLLPAVLILPRFFGLDGVWTAYPVADFLSTLISVTALVYAIKHLDRKHMSTLPLTAETESR